MVYKYWVSNSPSLWSIPTNWSGSSGGPPIGSIPSLADTVIYDINGTGNCLIDTTAEAGSFYIQAGYPGLVTSSDQTLQVGGNFSVIPGSFNHNNGLVSILNSDGTLSGSGAHFYSLQFSGDGSSTLIDGSCYVDSTLGLYGGYFRLGLDSTIHCYSDIRCGHTFGRYGVDYRVPLFMDGSGEQHLIVSSGSILPFLVVDKTTSNHVTAYGDGPIALDGNLEIWDGTFSTGGLDVHVGDV